MPSNATAEGPLPTPSGVSSIDLSVGAVRWTLPKVAYFAEAGEEVVLLQQGMLQEQYLAVDRVTGEMTRRMGTAELPQRRTDEFTHLTFPSVVDPQEAAGETQRVLDGILDMGELRGSIEYLRLPKWTILSFYLRDTKDAQSMLENKLVQELMIVEATTAQVSFRERLSTSANYPVSGSFFIFQDTLLYVKDGSELKSIALA